jgi:hypothetical protein
VQLDSSRGALQRVLALVEARLDKRLWLMPR